MAFTSLSLLLPEMTSVCPQRTNGRVAMIAFVGAAAAEAATGKTVLHQAAEAPILVLFTMFLISVASIFPKVAAGVPLAELIESTGTLARSW